MLSSAFALEWFHTKKKLFQFTASLPVKTSIKTLHMAYTWSTKLRKGSLNADQLFENPAWRYQPWWTESYGMWDDLAPCHSPWTWRHLPSVLNSAYGAPWRSIIAISIIAPRDGNRFSKGLVSLSLKLRRNWRLVTKSQITWVQRIHFRYPSRSQYLWQTHFCHFN